MLTAIRAVAFDLDNTLWEAETVIARAEMRLLEWLKARYPRIVARFSPEDMRMARQQLALAQPHRAYDFTYLRTAALASQALQCGYEEQVAHAAFAVFHAARNEVQLFSDVAPALQRLRARYVLASLTNGNADLVKIGIADLFSLSLSSRDVGIAKPHPRGFTELAARMKLQPHTILYVGDDPLLDVAGARAAGLRTAWLNRNQAVWPDKLASADIVVPDCLHLAEQLGV